MANEPTKRIALFPGTFDPFTIGHESLVTRGLELVDEIIVSIGINDKKLTYFSISRWRNGWRRSVTFIKIRLGLRSCRTTH